MKTRPVAIACGRSWPTDQEPEPAARRRRARKEASTN